jgi:hypothetical protein
LSVKRLQITRHQIAVSIHPHMPARARPSRALAIEEPAINTDRRFMDIHHSLLSRAGIEGPEIKASLGPCRAMRSA